MRNFCLLLGVALFGAVSTHAADREVRLSPDGRFYVGWFDHAAGSPFGEVRAIVFRSTSDPHDFFSRVSVPRSTDAAWNAKSTRCVLADAPDNGGPRVWLISEKAPQEWTSREIDPFSTLYEEFRKTDPEVRKLFRPSILNIKWLSETEVSFRGYCNTGTYDITLDTSIPTATPRATKLSDKFLEE